MIDSEGLLSINCKKFNTLQEAKFEQEFIVEEFVKKYSCIKQEKIEENICLFRGVKYLNELTELQTHIEIFDI